MTPQAPQEAKFQQQVVDIVTAFRSAFSGIEPPSPAWLQHWLNRYSFVAILKAIQALQNHPAHVRARFSQESVGRAISALLRDDAIKRAISGATTPGGAR